MLFTVHTSAIYTTSRGTAQQFLRSGCSQSDVSNRALDNNMADVLDILHRMSSCIQYDSNMLFTEALVRQSSVA